MSEQLVEEDVVPDKYAKFRVQGKRALYGFYEVSRAFFDNQPVPESAPWSKVILQPAEYDVEGNEISPAVTSQKKLCEYTIQFIISNDGEKVIVALAAMQAPTMRQHAITESDIDDWLYWVEHFGYDPEDAMGIKELDMKLATEEYRREV